MRLRACVDKDPKLAIRNAPLQGTRRQRSAVEGRARVVLEPMPSTPSSRVRSWSRPIRTPAGLPISRSPRGHRRNGRFTDTYLHRGTAELGLAAIVNVRDCTTMIKTGDLMRLDPGCGEVTVLARATRSPPNHLMIDNCTETHHD